MLDKLYEEYGKLMVQGEILNNRISEVKGKIAEALRQQQTIPVVKQKEETPVVKSKEK